jgi:hypothetical protein
VGAAGDAEWGSYKTLMEEAERLRWANAPAFATCQALNTARQGPSEARPDQVYRQAPKPAAEPTPSSGPARFRMSLNGGLENFQIQSRTTIPVYQVSGTYTVVSASPGSPPFGPGSLSGGPYAATGRQYRLATKAWEDQNNLSVTYAADGFDALGWRFSVAFGDNDGTIKQYLPHALIEPGPTIGSTPISVTPVTPTCIATPHCQPMIYETTYPYTQSVLGNGSNEFAYLSQLNSAAIIQTYDKFNLGGQFARTFDVATPLGTFSLEPGAKVSAYWWSFKQSEMASEIEANVNSPTYYANSISGEGPGFSVAATLGLGGRIGPGWPLKWLVLGSYGAEWVDLSLHDPSLSTGTLVRVRPTASFGGQIEYDFVTGWGAVLSLQQLQSAYLSTVVSASGAVSGVTIGGQTYIDLRQVDSQLYTLTLQHDF